MPGTTGVAPRRVVIEFDELVNVKDAFKNVVVSPVSKQTPRVVTSGRRVIVNFQDTLLPNTTYTIDFGNSIEDNNEGNRLQGFATWFSTGEQSDSLRISGVALDARTLEPQQGVLVGVHTNQADSAFRKLPMLRVARTDDYGRFTIRNLAPGQYRLFSLADLNNDFTFDNPEEAISFYPQLISPSATFTEVSDTLLNIRTGLVDTVVQRTATRFLPNDILLSTFKTDFKPQYLVKYERPDSTYINLIFNFRQEGLPDISLTDFPREKDWYRLSRSAGNDTLRLWLTPDFVRRDTLRVTARYTRTSYGKPDEQVTDSLTLVSPKIKPVKPSKAKAKTKTDTVQMHFIGATLTSGQHDVFAPLALTFTEPLARLDTSAMHLSLKADTIWKPAPAALRLLPDTLDQLKYYIEYPWQYGAEYKVEMDSMAAIGMYGHHNRSLTSQLRIKAEEDYANLYLTISGMPDVSCLVELLNSSDNPVRTAPVIAGVVSFTNVPPGKYFARLIADANGNGRWDAGDYLSQTQPEDVYYYPRRINLKKNWDVEQSWNLNEVPVDKQKPEEIKKNKPETPKNRRNSKKQQPTEDEDDEPFDVNSNPFAPSSRNGGNKALRRSSMTT